MRAPARARARLRELCSGPGKLTEALGDRPRAQRTPGSTARRSSSAARAGAWRGVEVATGPRIGITKATELPWRFCAAGQPLPVAAAAGAAAERPSPG